MYTLANSYRDGILISICHDPYNNVILTCRVELCTKLEGILLCASRIPIQSWTGIILTLSWTQLCCCLSSLFQMTERIMATLTWAGHQISGRGCYGTLLRVYTCTEPQRDKYASHQVPTKIGAASTKIGAAATKAGFAPKAMWASRAFLT